MPTLSGLGVAAVLSATLLSPVAPAGANPIATLQEQAASLSQQMLLEQLQINGFRQQRESDLAYVAADNAELRQMQTQLGAMHERIGGDLAQLRAAAVKVYVQGGTQAEGMNALFASTPSQGPMSVYAQVMTGSLSTVIDKLQTDRRELRTEESKQAQIAAAAQRQLQNATTVLTDAQSTEQKLSLQHADVTGALASAIAAQQAQEAAAARAAAVSAVPARPPASPTSGVTQRPPTVPAPAPPAASGALPQLNSFLRCVVQAESGGNYAAISPTGQYMGAFQFAQSTWNEAALLAGMPSLVGVPPYRASPTDQDLLAIALYNADGEQPWYDPCRS